MAITNWLEEVKEEAERLTLRRLKDDGFVAEADVINETKARVAKATEAEIVVK